MFGEECMLDEKRVYNETFCQWLYYHYYFIRPRRVSRMGSRIDVGKTEKESNDLQKYLHLEFGTSFNIQL